MVIRLYAKDYTPSPSFPLSFNYLSTNAVNAPPLNEVISPSLTDCDFEASYSSYQEEAVGRIDQITDPLWQKICRELLEILGPLAFSDLWKIQLVAISSDGKKVFLSCSSEETAKVIENYHFVLIDVLKKFYPALLLIETDICP